MMGVVVSEWGGDGSDGGERWTVKGEWLTSC